MDEYCRTHGHWSRTCAPVDASSLEVAGQGAACAPVQAESKSQGGIVFAAERHENTAPIPGYSALAPHIKPVRDPALSLIALSGIDPAEPVMVEVPLVLNKTTFTASELLSGWRIGFAHRYVRGKHTEPIEHSTALHRAFAFLRQAGAQLVPVDVQRTDDTLQFTLQTRDEIDDLVTEHRLDAVVSDGQGTGFDGACARRSPSLCETLEDGTKLWFYAAHWARDSLPILVRAYRNMSARESGGESAQNPGFK